MRSSRLAAIAMLLALPAAKVAATILDFDRNLACGAVVCAPGDIVSQSYGDEVDLDVSYAARSAPGHTGALASGVRYWDSGYSSFTDVAFAGDDSLAVIEIRLVPRNGASIHLNWAYLGGLTRNGLLSSYRLYDIDYNPLIVGDLGGFGPLGLAVGFSGIWNFTGFILQIGPDGHDVGLDRLEYSVVSVQSPVPEATTWAMLIVGFGAAGVAIRRRSKLATHTNLASA